MNRITSDIKSVMHDTWPMIILACVVLISLRITYLIKNKQKINVHQDLMALMFIGYILCLFQIVTSQDVPGNHGINITFFKELTRYQIGSHLFYRNIIGNIALFIPFGFFVSFYLKTTKKRYTLLLTLLVSIVIEFIQLQIGRAFDVDDLILNFIGGFLGYLVYRLVNKIFNKVNDNVKSIVTVILIMVIIFVIIILM